MVSLAELNIKIFADVGNFIEVARLVKDPRVLGFTSNPTLMRPMVVKTSSDGYENACRCMIEKSESLPISFEVFADEPDEMIRQAKAIASWGHNVYVKIPVVNTKGELMQDVVAELSKEGIKVNVTAVFTEKQANTVPTWFEPKVPSILSIFAGRIADTGRSPVRTFDAARLWAPHRPNMELLWASTRQVFNVVQAARIAQADIITVPPEILAKLHILGKDLDEFSVETVQQFHRDAEGFTL